MGWKDFCRETNAHEICDEPCPRCEARAAEPEPLGKYIPTEEFRGRIVESSQEAVPLPPWAPASSHDAAVRAAAEALVKIVEGIDGAMRHGTWRDELGMRLKDTPEWVALYVALAQKPATDE